MSGFHVGVTAARSYRPALQLCRADQMLMWLLKNGYEYFHHGDCIGGDEQLQMLAVSYFSSISHPPIDMQYRAFTNHNYSVRDPKPYLDRNRDIGCEANYMIGLPDSCEERVRSGTWSTLRFARKIDCPGCVIFPDGSVKSLEDALK